MSKTNVLQKFDLTNRVVVITGGAGIMGIMHAQAVNDAGGIAVICDIKGRAAQAAAKNIGGQCFGVKTDITSKKDVQKLLKTLINKYGRVDVLINNAANDPKVKSSSGLNMTRFENFELEQWQNDIDVGLTGAYLCSQVLGSHMAKNKIGVILNIASDLGVIAPDQRIYRKKGLKEEQQPAKPVTYSVSKHGLIGLTKYCATYWAEQGIRVNALCPGGIFVDQPKDFVEKLTNLIPLRRMAQQDEYQAAVLFLVSDASSYITGSVISADGGRSCW